MKNIQDDKKEMEELKKRFDDLCFKISSKICIDIYSYQDKHAQKILHDYGRFVSQFELYYETLIDLIRGVNYIEKKDWPQHGGSQFLLVVHNLKSLFSAFDRLLNGYYEDCFILCRPVIDRVNELIDLRERTTIAHPKEYWPQVIKDTKDIITMIMEVEENKGNWKESWQKIRSI